MVAPLNWGLGHASRCVPLIRALQDLGAEVQLASDGQALAFLKATFPALIFHELPAYDINYAGKSMTLSMLRQSAKMLGAVVREQQAAKKLVEEQAFDAIISDSRFGVFCKKIPSFFISHQLHLIAPATIFQKPVSLVNNFFLSNFDEIWTPDFAGAPNLSGKLSHPAFSEKIHFIGPLTHMKKITAEKKYDLAFVLSGPEPQRTIFEKMILTQAGKIDKKCVLVRGLPGAHDPIASPPQMQIFSFLETEDLNSLMAASEVVVARSGYSTVMDLWALEMAAILVPTPGQTEQEYLARKFSSEGIFPTAAQQDFDLEKLLKEVQKFPGFKKSNYLEVSLEAFLKERLAFL